MVTGGAGPPGTRANTRAGHRVLATLSGPGATDVTGEVPAGPSPTVVPRLGEVPSLAVTSFSFLPRLDLSITGQAEPPAVVRTLEWVNGWVPVTGNDANVPAVSVATTGTTPMGADTRKDFTSVAPSAVDFVEITYNTRDSPRSGPRTTSEVWDIPPVTDTSAAAPVVSPVYYFLNITPGVWPSFESYRMSPRVTTAVRVARPVTVTLTVPT